MLRLTHTQCPTCNLMVPNEHGVCDRMKIETLKKQLLELIYLIKRDAAVPEPGDYDIGYMAALDEIESGVDNL